MRRQWYHRIAANVFLHFPATHISRYTASRRMKGLEEKGCRRDIRHARVKSPRIRRRNSAEFTTDLSPPLHPGSSNANDVFHRWRLLGRVISEVSTTVKPIHNASVRSSLDSSPWCLSHIYLLLLLLTPSLQLARYPIENYIS